MEHEKRGCDVLVELGQLPGGMEETIPFMLAKN